MSLILEALRKSEAERRRGLAPDLFVELPPVARRRDSGLTPALWWALAVAVLAIGAWLMRGLWPSTPRAEVAVATTVPDDTNRQPSRERSAEQPRVVDAGPRSAGNVIAPPPPVTDAPPAPRPTPAVPDPPVAVLERPATRAPAPLREPLPPQANPAPAPVTEQALSQTPVPQASGDILQLADLSAEQRKQLPPLRISMHMWDQNPARRFVIIDGARLGEGDRIGDAVIEQITADSVLLDWNGRRLRLPLLR